MPLNIELKLEVWDSPNSAGIVIDAVRLAKLGVGVAPDAGEPGAAHDRVMAGVTSGTLCCHAGREDLTRLGVHRRRSISRPRTPA